MAYAMKDATLFIYDFFKIRLLHILIWKRVMRISKFIYEIS